MPWEDLGAKLGGAIVADFSEIRCPLERAFLTR